MRGSRHVGLPLSSSPSSLLPARLRHLPIHSLYHRFRKHAHFSCGSLLQDCKHPTPSCPANALTKQIQILFASASGVNVYFRNLTSRRAQKCVHQKTDALISHCAEGIEKHILAGEGPTSLVGFPQIILIFSS